ncbi:MAG: glycosyl transferase [Lachnospiraceae bacterium]|nr:glycosyl transferase [Lachnospiraceae bacterium]
MEIIAFYLPQFHEIPENDAWWGRGFTEWTSVTKSKPLFPGHNQPRVPLHGNYYNLLDKKVMEWQAGLARKAGVTGFCFYHYWFNGRQLLEKPVDNYLKWKDIPQRYCLSWANESWIRTWSNMEGNDWNEAADRNMDRKGPDVLMKQSYGVRADWEKHFYYLLPFFRDERYILYDGKPVFLIHKAAKIKCLNAMLECWNGLAKQNGLPGIYILATNCDARLSKYVDGRVMFEPNYTLYHEKVAYYRKRDRFLEWVGKKTGFNLVKHYSYDVVWQRIVGRSLKNARYQYFRGGFVDFDASPRRGRNAKVFFGVRPSKFEKYLRQLLKQEKEMLFINAWNEWAEGAYLEPDGKWGYGFLKAVKRAGTEISKAGNSRRDTYGHE